jgi:hypothetical protein
MANLSQLEHILQLCRKYGASSTSEQVDPLTGLTKTQAELLFHSVAE